MKPETESDDDEMNFGLGPKSAMRAGFMEGDIDVPGDFDRMGELSIEKMFGESE